MGIFGERLLIVIGLMAATAFAGLCALVSVLGASGGAAAELGPLGSRLQSLVERGEDVVGLTDLNGAPVATACVVGSIAGLVRAAAERGHSLAGLPSGRLFSDGAAVLMIGEDNTVSWAIVPRLVDNVACQSGTELALAYSGDRRAAFLVDLAITDPAPFLAFRGS